MNGSTWSPSDVKRQTAAARKLLAASCDPGADRPLPLFGFTVATCALLDEMATTQAPDEATRMEEVVKGMASILALYLAKFRPEERERALASLLRVTFEKGGPMDLFEAMISGRMRSRDE